MNWVSPPIVGAAHKWLVAIWSAHRARARLSSTTASMTIAARKNAMCWPQSLWCSGARRPDSSGFFKTPDGAAVFFFASPLLRQSAVSRLTHDTLMPRPRHFHASYSSSFFRQFRDTSNALTQYFHGIARHFQGVFTSLWRHVDVTVTRF